MWRRLLVICSEDVGMADPSMPALINALYQASLVLLPHIKAKDANGTKIWPDLQILQATYALAKAPKNREICDMEGCLAMRSARNQLLEMPDWGKDGHTKAGRAMGRGEIYFNSENGSGKLVGEVQIDGNVWHKRFLDEWKPDVNHPSRRDLKDPDE
jgi:replication-associated recombination protein RarA